MCGGVFYVLEGKGSRIEVHLRGQLDAEEELGVVGDLELLQGLRVVE